MTVRVFDIAGSPRDGLPPAPGLGPKEIRDLKSGLAVRTDDDGDNGPRWRWLGSVVTEPDGSQRLVVVGTGLVGFHEAVTDGAFWLVWVALLGALVAALATWLGVRSALRPVARMRRSVRALPPGRGCRCPTAQDELRALAGDFNELLARQEEAAQRLRRFTGDAAHELRSPVASIRVQAEVAVANPDPELAQETLADIAGRGRAAVGVAGRAAGAGAVGRGGVAASGAGRTGHRGAGRGRAHAVRTRRETRVTGAVGAGVGARRARRGRTGAEQPAAQRRAGMRAGRS